MNISEKFRFQIHEKEFHQIKRDLEILDAIIPVRDEWKNRIDEKRWIQKLENPNKSDTHV